MSAGTFRTCFGTECGALAGRLCSATFAFVVGHAVVVALPAAAANPSCPTYFAPAVVHTLGDHVRGKACYRESTDNWQFQDTYADGKGVVLRIPQNSLSGTKRSIKDDDGSNNGWRVVNSEYPEVEFIVGALCSMDFETGINYGCTSSTVTP